MNRTQLVSEIARRSPYTRDQVDNMLTVLIDVIGDTVAEGESVRVHGLGSFNVVDVKERSGKSPVDGSDIVIPEHKTVKFKVSPTLKNIDFK